MFPSSRKVIALALCISAVTVECSTIAVPDQIAANADFKLNISTELANATGYDVYRVFLAIDIGSALEKLDSVDEDTRYWRPSCYLAKSMPITTSDPTFRIPASAGTDGGKYAMVVEAYNSAEIQVEPSSGYEYGEEYGTEDWPSEVFSVTGGTGKWTESELETVVRLGYIDPVNVPCTAWDCARNCTSAYAGDNSTIQIKGNAYPTSWRDSWNCIGKCPGATYPAFNLLFGLDENYNEIITSTVLGPLSTTATKTVFATSVSYQGLPTTGSGVLASPTPFSNSTTALSGSPSSTSSRINTPTIDLSPSPTGNAGSRIGMVGLIPWLGSVLAVLLLLTD
ncbi:hypothetical protein BKA64DRAFT_683730 [Cadophora sp. MPI-SDFR-AT-0126]|nr:hypothetical protein BKA64DRAFT_683730 [Leotiomycetes sp. MPI-SDFR-AT-0126]